MRKPGQLLILIACLLLPACAGTQCKTDVLHVPTTVEIERRTYVAIDNELTTQHHVATGPIRECLAIAAARGTELRKCNAHKAAIRAIQGTDVPDDPKEERQP